ncbi:hypothetical protein AAH979_38485 [Plantactinospora sp. ZYX-F-223]|uniref:hypothetical protein n=1 Tax=Plantactinospora sp. ZYX-F-223 TaxID=3144103 RepID=UPI0031FBCA75
MIRASTPLDPPPEWAVLQRRLFDALDDAWRRFQRRYCRPDGSLHFAGTLPSRDGADDFYEAFFNWPALYFLGGADDLLEASKHHWRGVTRQLTELGLVVDEFERGYDWFHIGESMIFFYAICAADPGDAEFTARAARFADLYLPGSPTGNYDPRLNMIRAPHTGAGGPRPDINEEWQVYGADKHFGGAYGLPLYDLPGIAAWDDLADPVNARRMGQAMQARLGKGDIPVNLAATGLLANAWLLTGDDRYRDWVTTYVRGWIERTEANGGILPDNVGPSGRVGELHGGHWYGGHYGWQWPHGLHTLWQAALLGGLNARLVSGDDGYLGLPRGLLDRVVALGEHREVDGRRRLLVPYRHGPHGWFDLQEPPAAMPLWLWLTSMSAADERRLAELCDADRDVRLFRAKGEDGHERPWWRYLHGDNPDYPQRALAMALDQVEQRVAAIEADDSPIAGRHIHHWQEHNPVVTEVLLQLTTGAPQVVYNGGLYANGVRHLDLDRRRPGLPPDVAALVERVTADQTRIRLVNLSNHATRRLAVLAGAFGEHDFTHARRDGGDAAPARGPAVTVELPPATQLLLDLGTARDVRRPSLTPHRYDIEEAS